ncbi:zf-HC2 domain-containing protein [candidate division KSB1 bacterium]|nr:zf-HC2 domain-containing protein [candidate division KSB1 bacterium]
MNCRQIRKKLSPYIDEQLDSRRQEQVRDHLQSCQNCSTVLHQLEQLEDLLQDDLRLQADAFTLTRIKAAISAKSDQPLPVWSLLQKVLAPSIVFAGLVLGVLLGIQLHNTFKRTPIVEPQTHTSLVDSTFFEPLPVGSITATYVSMNAIQK